jgi:minor histocompatibility antigen H13
MHILCFLLALIPTIMYLVTKHYIMNNFFGILFTVVGIENLNLPSFKIGFVLLWGLFFYDIFWVYGTDVMLTVAKSVDAPIKLLFPLDLTVSPPKLSMLGLGDLVIPGIFMALCLKYDVDRQFFY